MTVLQTAVNSFVTTVLKIAVSHGFTNRGELLCNRGIEYIAVTHGFTNRGELDGDRGIEYCEIARECVKTKEISCPTISNIFTKFLNDSVAAQ